MTLILLILGFLGTLLPLLPGLFLIVIAAFINLFPQITSHPLSYFQFGVIFILFLFSLITDYFFGFIGAKLGGVSRAGLIMGIFGMIVGIFAGPWGIIVGPLLGVFLGELMVSQKSPPGAIKAAAGYAIGNLTGMIVKILLALAMSAYLIYSLWKA